nr:GtrA family protein [Pseudoduganella violacea]
MGALLQPQFLIYLAGGVLSAAADIGLFQLLLNGGMAPLAAASAGFLAGLLLNYAFHARFTFRQGASAASLLRYLSLVAVNYLLTLALVALSVRLLGQALPGKLLALPVVAASGFLAGKYWIFR